MVIDFGIEVTNASEKAFRNEIELRPLNARLCFFFFLFFFFVFFFLFCFFFLFFFFCFLFFFLFFCFFFCFFFVFCFLFLFYFFLFLSFFLPFLSFDYFLLEGPTMGLRIGDLLDQGFFSALLFHLYFIFCFVLISLFLKKYL